MHRSLQTPRIRHFCASAHSHWIYTMYRCLAIAGIAFGLHAACVAQVQRQFPATALRGELVIVTPPEGLLNGEPARLAPGARIRAENNMIELSAGLVGRKLTVNYTLEPLGLLRDVWILRPEEIRMRPWPRTPEEARDWRFDPAAQSWAKP